MNNLFFLGLLFWLNWVPVAVAQSTATVTVYAAASLKESLDELTRQFEKQRGTAVRVSYGASPALARQIEKGAPADIVISADREWMDYLDQRQRLVADSRVTLVSNRLVLIAPAAHPVSLTIAPQFPLAAALGRHRLALADPTAVPAGRYAKAALEALGVWPAVANKLAPGENVRVALALVARGEAPLGIVYRTDALAEGKVRIVAEFPAHLHPPIVYPAALIAGSRSNSAGALLQFLRTAEAQALWRKFGFVVEAGKT